MEATTLIIYAMDTIHATLPDPERDNRDWPSGDWDGLREARLRANEDVPVLVGLIEPTTPMRIVTPPARKEAA